MSKRATATKAAEDQTLFGSPSENRGPPTKLPPKTKKAQPVAVAKPAPQVAQRSEPKSMLEIIMEAVRDPRCDVEKMRALLAMQREIEMREQERVFNVALLAAQEEMPKVARDRRNPETKSAYATLENVATKIDHVARKHGFAQTFSQAEASRPDLMRIICDLGHSGGHVRRYFIELAVDDKGPKGGAVKTQVQGAGSSFSYGRRYLKIAMFDVVIAGEDNDGRAVKAAVQAAHGPLDGDVVDAGPVISKDQLNKVLDAIEECGVPHKTFCGHFRIQRVEELPADRFQDAIQACADYGKRKRGG